MELREFAEQVLFARSIEQKLWCPDLIVDANPGPALASPTAPGRPPELCFKPQGSTPREMPTLHQLESEHTRGRLLHFFANHELLATELMALVLLRFPEAPPAFRRGVLETLKDEQIHTRLYLERMRQCGIEFGELPVSGYFWRCLSNMANPMDYVAGLSLTFEQANLDFSQHFAEGFNRVGDTATARLLTRICRDEIEHVAYGLKWFRRWKDPQQTDWQAFSSQLKFPLSPQRAKGPALNLEGRRAAGLDPDFIAELNVFSQSKGRTPAVFWFNPLAEGRIAYGHAFTPKKHQAQLAVDLANLPQFLCRQDDVVLLPSRPPIEFLSELKQVGFSIPEFVEIDQQGIPPEHSLHQRKIAKLCPWAWSPGAIELFQPLFTNVRGAARRSEQYFNKTIDHLYSKTWSADLLRKFLSIGDEPWLCSPTDVGVAVSTLEGTLNSIAAIRGRGHHRVVAKQAFGLAGHNAIRLWEPELSEAQRRWLEHAFTHGAQLVIEPWLERLMDFSVQLEMDGTALKVCGYTGLINDQKGQFQANYAAPDFRQRVPPRVTSCFQSVRGFAGKLWQLYENIRVLLQNELLQFGYLGPVGIDAFVYRSPTGSCHLKPIVEINPRYTMGRVTVELMKHTCPGSYGLFQLVNFSTLRSQGCGGFPEFAQALQAGSPLVLEGEPVRRIRKGVVCLNDPARAQVCLALFKVGDGHIVP
jgi:uncharacterized ferritin-like protein (DUF455 family)